MPSRRQWFPNSISSLNFSSEVQSLCLHCLLGLSVCVSVKYLKKNVSKHRHHPVVWLLVSHAHEGAVQNKRLHLTFAFSLPSYPSSCLSARAVSHTNTNAAVSSHPTVTTLVRALHHLLCSLQQWLRSWEPSFQTPSFLYSASRMILLDQSMLLFRVLELALVSPVVNV